MFMDLVTCKRSEYDLIDAETGLYSTPPQDLLASIAWDADDPEEVVVLHVWRTPDARGEFAFEKIMPLAREGKVVSEPKRLRPFNTTAANFA
jgi:hypothetical protein